MKYIALLLVAFLVVGCGGGAANSRSSSPAPSLDNAAPAVSVVISSS